MDSEILDQVNDQDEVIGSMERELFYEQGLQNYRVINAFLVNKEGKVWLGVRHPSKKRFPLHLDMSIGGHVQTGESYEEGLKREALEELKLNLSDKNYKLLGCLTPKDGVSSFMRVYALPSQGDPDFEPADYVWGEWFTPEEVLKMTSRGVPHKGDLPIIIKAFF